MATGRRAATVLTVVALAVAGGAVGARPFAADPAEQRTIRITSDPAHLAWFKRLLHLASSLDKIGPGVGCLLTKSDQ